ncbi:MAG: filamentous hemagglutinin N-terminal domain-containing protein [Cyanobacteria bacterium P01_D01_bin.105]
MSNIIGTLGVDGAANLFLLNPNGIVFGETAQLDINGSFITSTADSIDFGNDNFFSAVNPQTAPLLAINTPIGLQYGTATSEIRVEGSGSQVFFDFNTDLTNKSQRPNGLEVPVGETLALLGGEIIMDGGNLTGAGGHIELAAE